MQYYDGEKWGDVTESQLDVTVDISTSGAKEMTVKYAGETYEFSCYVLGEGETAPAIYPYVGMLHFSSNADYDYVLVGTTAEEYFSNGRFSIYTNDGPQPYSGDDYTVVGWDSSTSGTEMMVGVFVVVDGVRYACAMALSVCAEEDLNKGEYLTVIDPWEETGEVTYFVPKGTDLSEGIPVRYQMYAGNNKQGIATATGYDKDQLGAQLVEIYCEEADCKETIILYVYDETNIIPKEIDFVFNNEDDEYADEITAEMFSIKITYCDGTQETLSGVDQKEYLRINGSDIYYYHPVQVGAETYCFHASNW